MIEDLPVAVVLPAPLGPQVAAWLERDLGWQVVDLGGSLPPALALAAAGCGPLPWIGVTEGVPVDAVATALLTAGASDVVAWPDDRDRIPLIATRIDLHRRVRPLGTVLSVGGVAGGVGTSTVSLAIGGLLAWAGATVLVVGADPLLALAGADAGSAEPGTAAPLPVDGVPRLSVARGDLDTTPAWSGDVVVTDVGTRVTAATSVVVARADAGLRRARDADRPVIVVGDQPLDPRSARQVLGREPLVRLPVSVRVARAGVCGRVPASLPGRWLRALGAGLRQLERRAA